jgi:cytoskeletal protein RodZ
MLEIGSTLEQAREERGLDLADVERETRLRERYLRALEQEQFDLLPPGSYRRTFLRGYATFLGLDAGVLVDEYVSRYEDDQPEHELPRDRPAVVRRRRRQVSPSAVVAVAVAAVVVGVAIWQLTRGGGPGAPSAPTTTVQAAPPVVHRPPKPKPPTTTVAKAPAPLPRVAFTASGGDCWLSIHKGSESGSTVWEGTLQQGEQRKLRGRRFWVRIGAPGSLTLTVNGKAQTLPGGTSNVTVDAHGVHPA